MHFTSFETLIQQEPHKIRAVFVSDLHLSSRTSALNQAFTHLLQQLNTLPNLHSLFVLGDWLDAWIGDDDYLSCIPHEKHWLHPIIDELSKLGQTHKIYLMHGNRDFSIRQTLCDTFGGTLLNEPHYLEFQEFFELSAHNGQSMTCRLEHGDKLCTDDVAYQRYRTIIRNPVVSWLLLKLPLAKRRQLASNIQSQANNQKSHKSSTIMDVNQTAVKYAMTKCDILIHGHTHRPAVHDLDNDTTKKRLVLGDWRYQDGVVQAVIGVVLTDDDRKPTDKHQTQTTLAHSLLDQATSTQAPSKETVVLVNFTHPNPQTTHQTKTA